MTAPEVLAIVPARGGSKGLPRKNMVLLGGRPLLAWSVAAARATPGISRVIVSSDDAEILAAGAAWGGEALPRSAANSTDDATSASVVSEVLDRISPYAPAILVLLQPTSPFRTPEQINTALQLLAREGANAVIGVSRPRHHPLKAMTLGPDGFLKGLVDARSPFLPRQQLPEAWQPNGALYIVRTEAFLASGFLPERTLPLPMDERSGIDIDDADDLRRAEGRLLDDAP